MEYAGLKSTPLLKLATPKIFQTELENTPNFKNILSTCFFCYCIPLAIPLLMFLKSTKAKGTNHGIAMTML